jgi:hypothetical protein
MLIRTSYIVKEWHVLFKKLLMWHSRLRLPRLHPPNSHLKAGIQIQIQIQKLRCIVLEWLERALLKRHRNRCWRCWNG